MLTSFSPKTDETDGMMDRPEENQTNSQRLLARRPPSPSPSPSPPPRLVELSEGTAAGGAAMVAAAAKRGLLASFISLLMDG